MLDLVHRQEFRLQRGFHISLNSKNLHPHRHKGPAPNDIVHWFYRSKSLCRCTAVCLGHSDGSLTPIISILIRRKSPVDLIYSLTGFSGSCCIVLLSCCSHTQIRSSWQDTITVCYPKHHHKGKEAYIPWLNIIRQSSVLQCLLTTAVKFQARFCHFGLSEILFLWVKHKNRQNVRKSTKASSQKLHRVRVIKKNTFSAHKKASRGSSFNSLTVPNWQKTPKSSEFSSEEGNWASGRLRPLWSVNQVPDGCRPRTPSGVRGSESLRSLVCSLTVSGAGQSEVLTLQTHFHQKPHMHEHSCAKA